MASLSNKSNSLQSKVLIHLRSIFKAAQENGLVPKSPVSSMLKPGGKKTAEKVALAPQETRLLVERVQLHTEMRRGEILGLMWEDIDFDQRIVHVRHNAILGKGETSIHDTLKTDAGRRDIPLTDELEAWLAKYKKRSHSRFVLAMQNGKPLTQSA